MLGDFRLTGEASLNFTQWDNKRILGFPTVKPASTLGSRSRPHQSQVLVDLRSGINSLNNFNQPASLGLQNFMEMAALRLEAVFVISRF